MKRITIQKALLILTSVIIISGCVTPDGSLDVDGTGRTSDSVNNPRKYKAFTGIHNKTEFENVWRKNPGQIFANFSHIAYYDQEYIESSLNKFGFEITFYDDNDGRQAFLAKGSNFSILSFRGTEPSDFRDLYDDVQFSQELYRNSTVHSGFLKATKSLMKGGSWGKGIEDDLKDISNEKVYATGHSLGAAMAVIAGMSYEFDKIVTFGEPRIGLDIDKALKGKPEHIRFVNGNDTVTTGIPQSCSYEHYGIRNHLSCENDREKIGANFSDHSIINYTFQIKNQGKAKTFFLID